MEWLCIIPKFQANSLSYHHLNTLMHCTHPTSTPSPLPNLQTEQTSSHSQPHHSSRHRRSLSSLFITKPKSRKHHKSTSTSSLSISTSLISNTTPPPPPTSPYSSTSSTSPHTSATIRTPLRPSEPWTAPPNIKEAGASPCDTYILSPFHPTAGHGSWDRDFWQEKNGYKATTAWERIGERRAREMGSVW
ncbi:hypothetical protein EJ08DRAFT_357852 [Tothia fuscella]|uniref:Uncharacterized protein n=1 Tax=Tothia fuscella TaxID=1048955 RepID=A0A9P4TW83_9PEZI|nr:hypothetical protein EJ08DRAFT_357852 [Tothia fuscella]